VDRPVSVRELEKLAADLGATAKVVKKAPTGRKVAVCGAGPAGLTTSYHLALEGCQVTVLDPSDRPGGFLKQVAAEKLPPEVLAREIDRLTAISGVQLRMKAVSLNSEEFDLIIVDSTACQPGSDEALAIEALARFGGHRLDIEPQRGAAGLRAVQVAHAVALGLRIASEACRRLNLDAGEITQSLGQVVTGEDMKFHRFPDKTAHFSAQSKGTADEEAVLDAERCLSCGTCNLCQNCVLACPDACCQLDEKDGKIVIDLYHCKGCGICAYECPRGVLVMESL